MSTKPAPKSAREQRIAVNFTLLKFHDNDPVHRLGQNSVVKACDEPNAYRLKRLWIEEITKSLATHMNLVKAPEGSEETLKKFEKSVCAYFMKTIHAVNGSSTKSEDILKLRDAAADATAHLIEDLSDQQENDSPVRDTFYVAERFFADAVNEGIIGRLEPR